jgi:hypothetical protein
LNIDVRWSLEAPRNGLRNVSARKRRHSLVNRFGALPIAAKSDFTELSLHHTWLDICDPNGASEKIKPQALTQGAHRKFCGTVNASAGINPSTGNGSKIDDVATIIF